MHKKLKICSIFLLGFFIFSFVLSSFYLNLALNLLYKNEKSPNDGPVLGCLLDLSDTAQNYLYEDQNFGIEDVNVWGVNVTFKGCSWTTGAVSVHSNATATANVTFINCTIDTLLVYNHSNVEFSYNGSSNRNLITTKLQLLDDSYTLVNNSVVNITGSSVSQSIEGNATVLSIKSTLFTPILLKGNGSLIMLNDSILEEIDSSSDLTIQNDASVVLENSTCLAQELDLAGTSRFQANSCWTYIRRIYARHTTNVTLYNTTNGDAGGSEHAVFEGNSSFCLNNVTIIGFDNGQLRVYENASATIKESFYDGWVPNIWNNASLTLRSSTINKTILFDALFNQQPNENISLTLIDTLWECPAAQLFVRSMFLGGVLSGIVNFTNSNITMTASSRHIDIAANISAFFTNVSVQCDNMRIYENASVKMNNVTLHTDVNIEDDVFLEATNFAADRFVNLRHNATVHLYNASNEGPTNPYIGIGDASPLDNIKFYCNDSNFGVLRFYTSPVELILDNVTAEQVTLGFWNNLNYSDVLVDNFTISHSTPSALIKDLQIDNGQLSPYLEFGGKLNCNVTNCHSDAFSIATSGGGQRVQLENFTLGGFNLHDSANATLENGMVGMIGGSNGGELNCTNVTVTGMVWINGPDFVLGNEVTFVEDVYLLKTNFSLNSCTSEVNSRIFIQGVPASSGSIRDSNLEYLRLLDGSKLVANDSEFDTLTVSNDAHCFATNLTIESFYSEDNAEVYLTECYIEELFLLNGSEHVNFSAIEIMKPTPDLPIVNDTVGNYHIILNWTDNPGQAGCGTIQNYTIYRANLTRGSPQPQAADYVEVAGIYNPTPLDPDDHSYNDSDIINKRDYYYKIGIFDTFNNTYNSSVHFVSFVAEINGTFNAFPNFDLSLTTYDVIRVNITILENDLDEDGTHDVDLVNVSLDLQNGTVINYTTAAYSGLEGSLYYLDIPAQLNVSLYTFNITVFPTVGFGTDKILTIGPYQVVEPDFEFSDLNIPAGDKWLEEVTHSLSVKIQSPLKYVQNVCVVWRVIPEVGGSGIPWQVSNMSFNNASLEYSFTFESWENQRIKWLEFYVVAYDIAGNEMAVYRSASDPAIKRIYPAFPTQNYSPIFMLFLIIGSTCVGLVVGVITVVVSKEQDSRARTKAKTNQTKLADEMKKALGKGETFGPVEGVKGDEAERIYEKGFIKQILHEVDTGAIEKGYLSMMGLFGGLLISGILFSTVIVDVYLSLILMIVAFLTLLFGYLLWSRREAMITIKAEGLQVKLILGNIAHLIGLLIVLLVTIVIGTNISWFNYYITQQGGVEPYMIPGLPFAIPIIYPKLIAIFFSGLVFLSVSIIYDNWNQNKKVALLKRKNASIGVILHEKETYTNLVSNRIGYKIILFLILIGVSIIPYSADGFATVLPSGLALIGPFALSFLAVVLITKLISGKKETTNFIIDRTKKCEKCGALNFAPAQYCQNCGTTMILEERFEDRIILCPNCVSFNQEDSKFCSSCGHSFETKGPKS